MTRDVDIAPPIEPGHGLMPSNPIVVGVDGSNEARRGLLFAADLAEKLDTELVVVHSYGLVGSYGDWRRGVDERERQVNAVMEEQWCAPLADRRTLKWSWRCVQGDAVGGVLRAADEVDAGFIVVGSHGAGLTRRCHTPARAEDDDDHGGDGGNDVGRMEHGSSWSRCPQLVS